MKVYLAGMESISTSYGRVHKESDNVFCSYFYKKNTTKFLESYGVDKGHTGLITVDSGAHSFFGYTGTSCAAHHNNKSEKDMPDPFVYFEQYLSWVKENYYKLSYFVELDIQSIIGLDKIKEWRQRMKDEGVYDKCIPVMHRCDTWEDFYEMLDTLDSGYIGLEGLRDKKINLPYTKMLKICYERGIRVHGFALTTKEITTKYPFYSVDSTTWTAPLRYGTLLVLENGSLKQVSASRENHIKYGFPVELNNSFKERESSQKKLMFCAEQTRKYENYLRKIWIARGIVWK